MSKRNPMALREVFGMAADLCAQGWCQGAEARGQTNRPCAIHSTRAVKFCATGALRRAAHDSHLYGEDWFIEKAEMAQRLPPAMPLTAWNDQRTITQEQVVAALRKLADESVGTRTVGPTLPRR